MQTVLERDTGISHQQIDPQKTLFLVRGLVVLFPDTAVCEIPSQSAPSSKP